MRTSFRLKIALYTAAISAVPLLVAGWLLIDVNEREVESATQSLQLGLVGQVADLTDAELRRVEGSLRVIADTLANPEVPREARLDTALRLVDAAPELDVIAIYDVDGALIDRMYDPRVDARSTPDRLDPALRDGAGPGAAIGEASADLDRTRVLLVVPIEVDHRRTGFVATSWSLSAIQAQVDRLSTSQLASREGVLALVDLEGRTLAHPDRARLLRPLAVRGTDAIVPMSEQRDEGGRTWLVTSARLGTAPWTVVASIPADVAYASLTQMRQIVGATIAATLLLAILAAFFFARRLAAPIAELVDFTKVLAARRFDRRVAVETGDELSILGRALNDAAGELERSEARVREEIAIRADLGRYLPAELVDAVVEREQSMELGGQRRTITVLFADVVAFTPLSDRLAPEEVVAILNELFTLLTEAVFRHGGTVDKFVGDCVMAVFGAPTEQADHAARALSCARDMLRFLESANAGFEDRYGVSVQLAIGVNTGDAVVGNVGSEKRMEYTAIGDVVNVAARLETIARPQQILVTRATADAAGEGFEPARIGEREVPGRAAPVELFEVAW